MKASVRNLYKRMNGALVASRTVGAIVGFQHRNLPLPVTVFAMLFRNRAMARLLAWYGHHVFTTDYNRRSSNEDYWRGDRSVYWHLYRGHDLDRELLNSLPDWPKAAKALQEAKVICEPGFGIGKMTRAMISTGALRPEKLIGLEPLVRVRKIASRLCRHAPVEIYEGDMSTVSDHRFDTLLVTGGVLMFYQPHDIKRWFSALPSSCKHFIVLGEGAPNTVCRDDDTYMHGLPALAEQAGFRTSFESLGDTGNYRLFIAER